MPEWGIIIDMNTLDSLALNIELVLISIIEGVALSALAYGSISVFQIQQNWQYIPFVFAGLAILVVFWMQAILHAISFVHWPLSMPHMLSYFFAAFLQATAFYSITNGVAWYFWWTLFSAFVLGVYFIDLRMLDRAVPNFEKIPDGPAYIQGVRRRHIFEMKYLVPLSILFNVVLLGLAVSGNSLFTGSTFWIVSGMVQFIVSFGALINCVQNFNERSQQIAILWGKN